ncbi:MAG: flippase-like domain-containing protein [Acidimicrobiales bacterium]|nr:flippase-like domain-containing protein [Acidimicrobiales bacterium]
MTSELEHAEELGEHIAHEEGRHALLAPVELIEDEFTHKTKARRIAESVLSVSVVLIMFAFIIPRLFDAEYRDVFEKFSQLDGRAVLALFVAWFGSMWTYWSFMTRTLPGLRTAQAGVLNLSGSAVANVVPFGGAVGVGATYGQCMSWGFAPPQVTVSILVSGVWNVFSKLAFPAVALVCVALRGKNLRQLDLAALVGLTVLVAAISVFWLIVRSEHAASVIDASFERIWNGTRRLYGREPNRRSRHAVVEFRRKIVGLVRQHWMALTIWMVAYKVSSFVLQLLCVRALGITELGWVEVLAAYTFGELLTTIPLTPSGVGFVEAGSAGIMVAFGTPNEAALAAVFLFRGFTYLFEIPAGGLAWLIWATRRSWRREINS